MRSLLVSISMRNSQTLADVCSLLKNSLISRRMQLQMKSRRDRKEGKLTTQLNRKIKLQIASVGEQR